MEHIPLEHGLALAAVLFFIGLVGLLVRRNLIFILMSVEIMLNAAGVALLAAGAHWGMIEGQILFIFILAMAASEVSIGLALVLQLNGAFKTLDADAASEMKG